jgi:hypothetical protein
MVSLLEAMAPCRSTNLGPADQDWRLRLGVGWFGISLVLAVALAKLGVAAPWRLLLALPFFVAVFLVTQALGKTCSFMAAKGLRASEDGPEAIADPNERAAVRRRGRQVVLMSAALALVAASLFSVFPG